MGLSRKRQRELKRLKAHAEAVLHDQREVLDHAAHVVRSATKQAARYTREEVSPRVRDTFEGRIMPALSSGAAATRSAAHQTRERFVGDVLPAVTSALGTALAALEVARSPQVRDALSAIGQNAQAAIGNSVQRRRSSAVLTPQRSSGPGRYILLGVGIVAAAGVAYAAWQTLRADDDLWIDDDAELDAQTPEEDAS